MSPEMVGLLIQVPLVGAFIIFTMILLRWFHQHEQDLQEQMMQFIDTQNARWQEVLEIERERRKEAMDQGLKEVEAIVGSMDKHTDSVLKLAEGIARHDQAARERHSELVRNLSRDRTS